MVRSFAAVAAFAAYLVAADAANAASTLQHKNTILERLQLDGQLEAGLPDLYFDKQILDHGHDNCGGNTTAYWKQRYHVNDEFYGGAGSPVFLYIHGENVAEPAYITSKGMHVVKMAQTHKALLVALEHRFYGKSQPTSDMSDENLKYLSADNAIGDIATFQDFFVGNRNISAASPWVAFGGSYPGMLAAWTKLQLPKRFVGSVASSAPIDLVADFHQYADIVARGLKQYGGDECLNTLREGLKQVHALVESKDAADAATFKKLFKPCTAFGSEMDKMLFEQSIMGTYQGFAQGNDYEKYALKQACADLTAKNGLTPLEKVAKINQLSWNPDTPDDNCSASDYINQYVIWLKKTETDTVNIYRQWTYQTCAEFGFGQTGLTSTSPFSELKYLSAKNVYYQLCKDVYGIENSDARIAAKMATFHGLDINVENVIFPSGTLDPWSALAPDNSTHLANSKSKVVYIEGTSHCADMSAPRPTDSGHMVWAHQQIEAAVASYVGK
ncbi:hypothetical protein SPRG_15656 [Saprolegnia parasitica CBS 223.65]|uniref:Serine protease n=1 Tax=Saprolegnia parasitica (strain CBS 223.65) TaxID=695850 RepID=A0A067BM11_SAPPC|nr:hypothetical protein SPRG_15656 [Saprolegnia parasitica CBS 223.65]KDO19213.1 hypothetical protein SPRG_15656 [Saprolegnia parasitica CBS 223.65]|eukprot:XP_012210079.1 hypothetical protein SPRG_15656 [Saprolegnia parasitica CBS 223.65]